MSASSLTLAKRHGGVCEGSLVKAIEAGPHGRSSTGGGYLMSSKAPIKVPEYCVLVGIRLICFESWLSMDKGDHPTAIYSVVGASAVTNANDTSFRVVTNQGTHLWCCPPSTVCRELWLRALHAGLERHFASSNNGSSRVLKPVKPRYHATNMRNPPKSCNSCGKLEKADFPLIPNCSPLAQYGMESRMDMCSKCSISQGVVEHIQWMQELYAAQYQEHQALEKSRIAVLKALKPGLSPEEISNTEPTTNVDLTPLSHHKLSGVLTSAECIAQCRLSPTLERLCIEFSQGMVGCMEFVELLERAIGIKDQALAKLKQQAFRVNGDMGTALKLLAEHAIPNPRLQDEADNAVNQDSTELLQCILEFFLDLLDEGELQSVAFFWPQLLNLHLQMLPASDSASLQRVELVEDFLLTVSTQHSVQLAAELIWSHTADLEDALTLPYCAKRRYAVLRFLCELESLLFDFEMGWGGGSMTVGQFLGPSTHQIAILKSGMRSIQSYRLSQPERISRSQRHKKLARERDQRENGELTDVPPEQLAAEALRIAKNADYLSTHMAFTKRLGDVAGRLFYQPVEKRKGILENELSKLNSSGTMGGDPLNRVKVENYHTRVVRIPMKEGHVFRSKERTPVLLLVETLDEGAEEENNDKNKLTPFPQAQPVEEEHEEKKNTDESEAELGEEETPPKDDKSEEGDAPSDTPNRAQSSENDEENVADSKTKEEPGDGDTVSAQETAISPDDIGASEVAENSTATAIVETGAIHTNGDGEEDTGNGDIAPSTPKQDVAPSTPKQEHRRGPSEVELCGSQEGLSEDLANGRHALRRFDSPKGHPKVQTPTASKESVEALVTNVVAKQLQLPALVENESQPQDEAATHEVGSDVDSKLGNATISEAVTLTPDLPVKAKMTALGSGGGSTLSKLGDTRREVLNSLMMKGMSGGHSLAAGTAVAVQRQLQDLERRRAVELLLTGSEDKEGESPQDARRELLKMGIRSISRDDMDNVDTGAEVDEDNEAMEAIRLLLIQYQVGQGSLSMNDAAKVLAPHHRVKYAKQRSKEGTMMHFGREFPEIDAGDIDPRLIGCGTLPPAVLQALTLRKANMISNGELLELVKKDLEFVRSNGQVEADANKDKLHDNSAFWGRFAFGERWAEKRSRIAASSPDATNPGWDLIGVIVKANDDLRQEAFIMQLIELCREAFEEAGLELWLLPYRILSTGRTTGIIEMVRNAMSFDALKKRPGYGRGGLREHLHRMTQYAADPGEAFKSAQKNFVRSIAAYSLLSYLFLFKDRHNGNILLDTAGHVIHIDFGFVFGIAPGGSFSFEISTPFKMTEEMIEVMDGLRSSLFSEFITLFCCGFLALQAHCDTFCTVVEISCKGSTFKCFEGRDSAEVVGKLRQRFRPDLSKEESIAFCLDLIKDATQSYGTAQYDYFQYLSQGIAA